MISLSQFLDAVARECAKDGSSTRRARPGRNSAEHRRNVQTAFIEPVDMSKSSCLVCAKTQGGKVHANLENVSIWSNFGATESFGSLLKFQEDSKNFLELVEASKRFMNVYFHLDFSMFRIRLIITCRHHVEQFTCK